MEVELSQIQRDIVRLRGNPDLSPDASIIIPVNARGDLKAVLGPLNDIIRYKGGNTIEIILVINNYHPDEPPIEINEFLGSGIHVVACPSARQAGEVVIMSARSLGVKAAKSGVTIHFDADCRIPDINALLDWYVKSFNSGFRLAYSHVGYYDIQNHPSVYAKIAIHHTVRWFKRNILKIPTTRGSNYAIDRSLFLQFYDAGKLSVDLQVGPVAKLSGVRIAYSGNPRLRVFTSGRRFRGGWNKMVPYFFYRLRYNIKAIPTRWREINHTSWIGFDEESERRKTMEIPENRDSFRNDH